MIDSLAAINNPNNPNRISVITFGETDNIIVSFTGVTDANKESLKNSITISADETATWISNALQQANSILDTRPYPHNNPLIIIVSPDARFNDYSRNPQYPTVVTYRTNNNVSIDDKSNGKGAYIKIENIAELNEQLTNLV